MLQEQQQLYAPHQTVALLQDRRTNPYIRTRQRRNFDRRGSKRVGLQAMTFIRENGSVYYGRLRDISDGGAHLELHATEVIAHPMFSIGIPLLSSKPIQCEKVWVENSNERTCRYGVRFVSLSPREKTDLRKRYLLETALIAEYADALMLKAHDPEQQKEIKTFFLVDVSRALERLIEIDHVIAEGAHDDGQIMRLCTEALDELLGAGDRLDRCLHNEPLMHEVKQRVRFLLGHFIYQSTAFRRAFEKPHGYPGDYKTLELVYEGNAVSSGIGKYLDRYGIAAPYSQAIRLRKDLMRDMLRDFIIHSEKPELHILNLASGGCREIRELARQDVSYPGTVRLVCIDQDPRAIDFSRSQLSGNPIGNLSVEFVQGNILKLDAMDLKPENGFDMIYSIGIADYLQDRMLKKIFHDSFKKLAPGGRLVVAYKDKDRHRPIAFNWYGDWYFIPRNEAELLKLIHESLPNDNIRIRIEREPSGIIFFAVVTKIK